MNESHSKHAFRIGVTGKIIASLLVMAIAGIAAGILQLGEFNRFQQRYNSLSEQHLPALNQVVVLFYESNRLITLAPDILQTENRFIRASLLKTIEQAFKRRDSLLNELDHIYFDPEKTARIRRQFERVKENVAALVKLADLKFTTERKLDRMRDRLAEIAEEMHTNRSLQQSLSEEFRYLEILFDRLLFVMLSHRLIFNKQDLQVSQVEFNRLWQQFDSVSQRLIADERVLLAFDRVEIEAYGKGEGNLYQLQGQVFELKARIDDNLLQNRFLADALMGNVNEITTDLQKEAREQGWQISEEIEVLSHLLYLMPVLMLAFLLGIYLYVRRSILGRLLQLQLVMKAHARGERVPVRIRGNDEITDMAHSVGYYLEEIHHREIALKEALFDAQAADRAKSAFLSNMTHELHTPLNAILGFSEMMASSQELPPAARKNLEIISRNGRLLLERTGELLNMSNLESGQLQLHLESVNPLGLAEQLLDHFQKIAEDKGLRYRLEKQMDYTGYVMADLSKLRHVLHNILSNAFKFTAEGGVTLMLLSRQVVSTDRVQLRFEVSDTGSGIAREDLERIFEPFVQVGEPAVHTGMWGTGLGLSVSRRFVEMMGGNIEVESTLEKGTLFRIDLEVQAAPQKVADLSDGIKNEPLQQADSDGTAVPATSEMMALPIKILSGLLQAAEVGDGVEALSLINTLEAEHAVLAAMLTRLVEDYHFYQLVVSIQAALQEEK